MRLIDADGLIPRRWKGARGQEKLPVYPLLLCEDGRQDDNRVRSSSVHGGADRQG